MGRKLIRDKLISRVRRDHPEWRLTRFKVDAGTSRDDIHDLFVAKFAEEVEELRLVLNDKERLEEIADIYTVVMCYAQHMGFRWSDVCRAEAEKAFDKGRFHHLIIASWED